MIIYTVCSQLEAQEILSNGALLAAHWEEVAKNKDIMVLKPDVAKYNAINDAGKLLAITAHDDETGKMVGYSVTFLDNHLHYVDLKYAHNDVIFVDKELRHKRIGLLLIQKTVDEAKRLGAQLMLWHAKEGTPFHELLVKMGYVTQDIILSKRIA